MKTKPESEYDFHSRYDVKDREGINVVLRRMGKWRHSSKHSQFL